MRLFMPRHTKALASIVCTMLCFVMSFALVSAFLTAKDESHVGHFTIAEGGPIAIFIPGPGEGGSGGKLVFTTMTLQQQYDYKFGAKAEDHEGHVIYRGITHTVEPDAHTPVAPPWEDVKGKIAQVYFGMDSEYPCTSVQPKSTAGWFDGCTNLTEVTGAGKLDTSEVTSMANMFKGCQNLTYIDTSEWSDMESVTDMSNMFNRCENLRYLNTSNWETDGLTLGNTSNMFNGCALLKELDFTKFKTTTGNTYSNMFDGCVKLAKVTLNNTSKFAEVLPEHQSDTDIYRPEYPGTADGFWYNSYQMQPYNPTETTYTPEGGSSVTIPAIDYSGIRDRDNALLPAITYYAYKPDWIVTLTIDHDSNLSTSSSGTNGTSGTGGTEGTGGTGE